MLRVSLDARIRRKLHHRDHIERRAEQRGAEELGAGGQYPDDGAEAAVDRILLVQYAVPPAESPLPVTVAQDDGVARLPPLIGVEESPDLWSHAEDVEKVRRDGERGDTLRAVGAVQRCERRRVERH